MRARIRPLTTAGEWRDCERIQRAVWGAPSVSAELLGVTQKYGGGVIGAVVEKRVVGFIYAFLARRKGRLVHWSHLMAVEPEYRDRGLGFQMKLAHREFALRQGLSSICWTYDPLQSRNATLNITKLGAQADEYIPDCYGQFPSVLEKGLPSDRLVLEWRIASSAVIRRLSQSSSNLLSRSSSGVLLELPRVNQTRWNSGSFIENQKILLNAHSPRVLVEVPRKTQDMREKALDLARRWRMETRRIFLHYFQAGYRVTHFIPPAPHTEGRCFYVLGLRTSDRKRRSHASPAAKRLAQSAL